MADGVPRSLAEKLAAGKKKYKALMKEKGLKNVPKQKDFSDTQIQPISNSDSNDTDQGILCETKPDNVKDGLSNVVSSKENLLQESLPLPQNPMDYSYQQQTSSLPDPLSFFDNLPKVGATFQNFAQPLASFFNTSNNNHNDDIVELPNQIVVEELIPKPTDAVRIESTVDEKSSDSGVNLTNVFSYDKFKNNAINPPLVDEVKKTEAANMGVLGNQVFDSFTNSSSEETKQMQFEEQKFVLKNDSHPTNINPYSYKSDNGGGHVPALLEVGNDNHENTTGGIDYIQSSNLHTLQKISNEMEELINQERESPYISNSQISKDSDKKNQELLALLEQQNGKCNVLSSQLQEAELKYSKLLTEFRTMEIQKEDNETFLKLQADIEIQNELSKLKEDLQCHLQTISMLVADKTELSALLNETQSALKSESSQHIDLQNKIREMRLFYSDLEHELESLKSEKMNFNSSQKEQNDMFNQIKEDYSQLKLHYEELNQDLLESKEKLKATSEINSNLQNQVQDMSGQLSLANIKIQQLSLGDTSQQDSQIEKLMQEKMAYEKQISFLNEALKSLNKEREESAIQYQQYTEQLNGHISNLAMKLQQFQKENEQLKIQEENRIRHIGDLEKQLQSVQSDTTSFSLQKNNSFLKKELESAVELANRLQSEKEESDTNLTKTLVNKELLEKELESCKFSISALETTVEQLKGSQPDNAVLLATMESDKVAASRAISQNNELKKQMEGMQEVLLKVNNDNVQLTESISMERKTNRDLLEKLQKTEISFQTLAEAIEIKDKELVNLRDQLDKLSKQFVQQEQLSDRLRHYEAREHSNQSLQNELQDAKQMIAHLTNELNILKKNQLNQTNQMNQTNEIDQTNQNTQTYYQSNNEEDTVAVSDESDIVNELKNQLNNLQIRNNELESLLQTVHKSEQITDTNGNESLDKETAMKYLEKKFMRTMEEIAKLTEEKQKLEHIVLQLQGETETIGEYVTLYQQQRSILKQRAMEKDQQLQQLTNDRELIKMNLDRLNNLVNKLILEKGGITKELLEQHEHFSRERDDLCAEHQKIHQEINKITHESLKNSQANGDANTEIAEEIISLLSEIKCSNLVQPVENIHHCPWCTGKLITV